MPSQILAQPASRNRSPRNALLAALALLGPLAPTPAAAAALKVTDLRCEYHVNPIGIDVQRPRFSWVLQGSAHDQVQSAYQVLTWNDAGPVWDSGRVTSSQSIQVEYAGRPLAARERISWKVRIWDAGGKPSESKPANFEMGLLGESDWGGALWIGKTIPSREKPIVIKGDPLRWIWYPEGNPAVEAPAGDRLFRRKFTSPAPETLSRALFVCAADGGADLHLNGARVGHCEGTRKFMTIDVSQHLRSGENLAELHGRNKERAAGVIGEFFLEGKDGKVNHVGTDRSWQTAKHTKGAVSGALVAAREVARIGEGPEWNELKVIVDAKKQVDPATFLRRDFTLRTAPRNARVSATALGLYELWINGKRVGRDYFTPGWTDYDKRVQVQTYDVTRLLKAGPNTIAAVMGDGWFAGHLGLAQSRANYEGSPRRLRAKLDVEYGAGAPESVITDTQWKTSEGPVRENDFFLGEKYDARLEMDGWNAPRFDDKAWTPIDVVNEKRNLVAEPGGAVRVTQELKPKTIKEIKPGTFIFDLGQNMVGWVRLRVKGPAGATVTIKHAEILNPDGTIYTTNLRTAASVDTYTLRGKGQEIWEPRFTFHGFRYVELSGYPGRPGKDSITGVVAHSDIPTTLSFTTGDRLIDQLQTNIDWGQRGNFLSVPTDCPQRDERLGWTGDAQIFVRTACYNRDVAAFFTKWVRDLNDAQTAEGGFPDFAPRAPRSTNAGSPAWGDAGLVVPWTMYECYDDKRLLSEAYPYMVKWVEYIRKNNPTLLWKNNRGADYGDWLSIADTSDKELVATAFFARSAGLVAQSAAVLGRADDARAYQALFDKISAAFTKAYLGADGKLRSDTQTAYALALRFRLLPEAARAPAGAHLVRNVVAHGDHLSTGFVGVAHLLPALSMSGHEDVAYRLLRQETFPSWLYSIKQGATTIWERWDGWTHDKGFQDAGMNSFNHYSFGSVGEWMYTNLAGMEPAEPGWKKIRVRPRPGGNFDNASARLRTMHGELATAWSVKNKKFQLKVTIPANTTADIHIPGTGKAPAGARANGTQDGATVYQVGSGAWTFDSAL